MNPKRSTADLRSQLAGPAGPNYLAGLLPFFFKYGSAFVLALVFVRFTGLIPDGSRLYSTDLAYRLQTERMLQGRIALSGNPSAIMIDWAWNGTGAHQVWGLGLPLLRLPFEFAARLAGFPAFPDRIVLFLLLWAAAAAILDSIAQIARDSEGRLRGGAHLIIAAAVLFDPMLFGVAQSRMESYEEAALALLCWNLVIWSSMLNCLVNPCRRHIFGLAFLSGFAIWIRPTGLLFGFSALAIASAYGRKQVKHRRSLLHGWAIFAATAAGCLAANWARFGSPLEFGHSLNLTFMMNALALRFGHAFGQNPLADMLAEFDQALFACSNFPFAGFFDRHPCGTELSALRMREYYFNAYTGTERLALILSFLAAIALLIFNSARQRINSAAAASLFFGLTSFSLLSLFYLRSWALTSRYLLDFLPAFAAAAAGLLGLFAFPFGKWGRAFQILRSAAFIGLCSFFLASRIEETIQADAQPGFKNRGTGTLSETIDRLILTEHSFLLPYDLPDSISCPAPDSIAGLPKFWGWNFKTDCWVQQMTSIMMPPAECISLQIEFPADGENWFQIEEVAVRRGLEFLKNAGTNISGTTANILFCGDKPDPAATASLYSIRWKKAELKQMPWPRIKARTIATARGH